MANTTNFGWETPDDTDLVKDGAAAIRTLGSSIDTSFVDLKGGTTGQVLAKATNTDLDFTWVAQDDSNAIQNAIVDAKGDLISATAADTPARLAVGANGTILTADSSTSTGLKWATLAAVPTNAVSTITTLESTTSTTYTDLATAGPEVTITTGTKALVIISAAYFRNGANSSLNYISLNISGASSVSASDGKALLLSTTSTGNSRPELGYSFAYIVTGLTAGSNTFTCKYRCSTGTLQAGDRSLSVIDMGS